jgi:hypothetical protein
MNTKPFAYIVILVGTLVAALSAPAFAEPDVRGIPLINTGRDGYKYPPLSSQVRYVYDLTTGKKYLVEIDGFGLSARISSIDMNKVEAEMDALTSKGRVGAGRIYKGGGGGSPD